MSPDKLSPTDDRVEHRSATVRGKTYHYLHAKPPGGKHTATVLLIHGFPDLAFGWRCQILYLASLGLQVVAPDQLGYGRTDSPADVAPYALKSIAADMAALLAQVAPGERVILGGHDWGGFAVWRIVLWQPQLVRAVFSICTPYSSPQPVYLDVDAMAEVMPNFAYQRQFAGDRIVEELRAPERLRRFFRTMQGVKTVDGQYAFSVKSGVDWDRLDKLVPVGEAEDEEEIGFYAQEYARHGLRGPTNWYRTRKVNYDDEVELLKEGRPRIRVPSLFIGAEHDTALPPRLADGMERSFDDLTKRVVKGSHWVLRQNADEVNPIIGEFVKRVLATGGEPKASL